LQIRETGSGFPPLPFATPVLIGHVVRRFVGVARLILAGVEHQQLTGIGTQHDLGRIILVAFPVGPLAGFELAFDVNLRALLQIFLRDANQPVGVDRNAVPFRALLALAAGLVLPALAGGDG